MDKTPNDTYSRDLLEHAGVAVVACEVDQTICLWNQAAVRLFGKTAEQMMGAEVLSVIPRDQRNLAEKMLRDTLQTHRMGNLEFKHHGEHGRESNLICTIAPVVTEEGRCRGVSMWIRDITHRMALQNELNESRKMAALGEFAGAVSHHFNNILGGVITSVDFAASSDNPAVANRVLWQTGRELLRATSLIKSLLAFAKGDHRDQDLSDFTEIVNQVADDLEPIAAQMNITFSLHMPRLAVMEVGRRQLTTVLRNITQNAMEAMSDGGRLEMEVAQEDQHILIRITDTGRGMDESTRSRVFEPFWSTKQVLTAGSTGGVGLGLAVAHGIVQMMGGQISVTSQLHIGSCFTVSLPIPMERE